MTTPPDTSGSANNQNVQQLQEPVQSPLAAAFALGLENPLILNQPAAGTPAADINAQNQRPQRLIQGQPPLHGPGVLSTLNTAGTNVIQMPLSLASSQQPNQANIVPVVPVPVLSRMGPGYPAFAAAITIASKSSVTIRGSYRDLKMTPGFRGMQIAYGNLTGNVTIACNITGMTYQLPDGPGSFFLPLYMLMEIFDFTITAGNTFSSNATCLLVTEEQLPYAILAETNLFSQQLASVGTGAASTATATLTSAAGRTVYVSNFQITGLGATGASVVAATLTGVLGGTQTYQVSVPAGATTSITPVQVNFNPALAASAANTNIVLSVPSFGAGNTFSEVNLQGFII